jgi:hypothetical protein
LTYDEQYTYITDLPNKESHGYSGDVDLIECKMRGKNDTLGDIAFLKPVGVSSEVSGPVGR